MPYTTTAIVVAAGNGDRMKSEIRKPFLKIGGRPVITYCLDLFEKSGLIDNVVLVLNSNDIDYYRNDIAEHYEYLKIVKIVKGGGTRQESVYNGLIECPFCDIVLIHDAARPFIDEQTLERSISDAHDYGASVVGIPMSDTVKMTDENGFIESTLNRENIWHAQTPQTFRAKLILEASEYAREKGIRCTDDACLIESFGLKVKLTRGNENNIKITTPKDLLLAEQILKERKT